MSSGRLLLAVSVLLLGCPGGVRKGDGGVTGADNGRVRSIVVTPSQAFLVKGEQLTFVGHAYDETGNLLNDVTFTWKTLGPDLGKITDGEFAATVSGGMVVTATVNGVSSDGATLAVVDVADDAPSTESNIGAALTAGTITAEEALTYRVFAAFKDSRLPPQYLGAFTPEFETAVLDDLTRAYDSLSADAQSLLGPFLLPPADRKSFRAPPGKGQSLSINRRPSCEGVSSGWVKVNGPTAHVNVWYQPAVPGDLPKAQTLTDAIENDIWPKLVGALGYRPPLSDAPLSCNMGDGKYDVYLVENMSGYGLTVNQGDAYSGPVYTLINHALSGDKLRGTMAHELMHAIHWGYKTTASQDSYGWFRDALANWAIDAVYGAKVQVEQTYADCYLSSTYIPLDDRQTGKCRAGGGVKRDYGAYLFFQWAAKTYGEGVNRSILEATSTGAKDAASAIDAVLADGLKDNFWKFAKTAWNQDPIDKKPASFKSWDALAELPKAHEEYADLMGAPEATATLTDNIDHLAIQFYHFKVSEPETRGMLFRNGYFDEIKAGKQIKVTALWNDDSGTWNEEDWTENEYTGLCRDLKNQRASELVIIISNAEKDSSGNVTASKAPELRRTNVGCYKYSGTAKGTEPPTGTTGPGRISNSNLDFQIVPGTGDLAFRNPNIKDTLRVGPSLVMTASGSFNFQINYADSECGYHFGPATFGLDASAGFLELNPFSDLKSADASTQRWFAHAVRSYSAAAVSSQVVTVTETGDPAFCHDGPDAVGGLILTNASAGDDYLNPPVANAAGNLVGSFHTADFTSTWDLHPVRE